MSSPKYLLMLPYKFQRQLLLLPKYTKKNPSCMDCLFCISASSKNKKGEHIHQYKCTKFNPRNKITQQIAYENISDCRNDENKCGKSGKYYIPFRTLY